MTVKLQRPSTERSRPSIYSPGFPSMLPLSKFSDGAPASPACGSGDLIPQLASASGKEGARSDQKGRGPR